MLAHELMLLKVVWTAAGARPDPTHHEDPERFDKTLELFERVKGGDYRHSVYHNKHELGEDITGPWAEWINRRLDAEMLLTLLSGRIEIQFATSDYFTGEYFPHCGVGYKMKDVPYFDTDRLVEVFYIVGGDKYDPRPEPHGTDTRVHEVVTDRWIDWMRQRVA